MLTIEIYQFYLFEIQKRKYIPTEPSTNLQTNDKKYALERSTVCLKIPFLYSSTRYENEQDFLDILYTILYVDRVKSKGLCSSPSTAT